MSAQAGAQLPPLPGQGHLVPTVLSVTSVTSSSVTSVTSSSVTSVTTVTRLGLGARGRGPQQPGPRREHGAVVCRKIQLFYNFYRFHLKIVRVVRIAL